MAPVSTEYELQCWGASAGALGGYVTGTYDMQKSDVIYICVGGSGNCYNNQIGTITSFYSGTLGGGCTSITSTNRGELKNFKSYKSEVLIVAGGGGGRDWSGTAGAGGGLQGLSGNLGGGGTQTQGGASRSNGSYPTNVLYNSDFGMGGMGAYNVNGTTDYGAQGGGGWYGGGSAIGNGGAGGGSSYYGGVSNGKTIAGNASMPSPTGDTEIGHSGQGNSVITWYAWAKEIQGGVI